MVAGALAIVMEKSRSAAFWFASLAPLPSSLKTSFVTVASSSAEQCVTVVVPSVSLSKVASSTVWPSLSLAMTLRSNASLLFRRHAGMPAAVASVALANSFRPVGPRMSCLASKISLPLKTTLTEGQPVSASERVAAPVRERGRGGGSGRLETCA